MKIKAIIFVLLIITSCADKKEDAVQVGEDITLEERLFYNIKKKRVMMIEGLIKMGVDVNKKSDSGFTPLSYAVLNLQFSLDIGVLNMLIEAGADVNLSCEGGTTPLMYASGIGNIDAMKILIDSGADIDLNTTGTPLMEAAKMGRRESIKFLLSAGADNALKNIDGESALDIAKRKGHGKIIPLLEGDHSL